MSELPHAASEVLRQVRQAHDPSRADVERSLSRLQASLSFGVDPVQAATQVAQPVATAAPQVGAALFTAKALKLCVVVAALGGSITAGLLTPGAPTASVRKDPALVAAQPVQVAAGVHATVARTERAEQTDDAPAALAVQARAPARARSAAAHAKPRHEAVSPAMQALPTVPEVVVAVDPQVLPSELDLISRAATSLRDGQLSRALGLLDEHRALYPAGLLRTEQQGLRVLVLCGQGQRAQASQLRTEFLRHAGRTPLAARVRRACVAAVQP